MLPKASGAESESIASACDFEKVAINNHERIIVYRLGAARVFYDQANSLIYFADFAQSPVIQLLQTLALDRREFRVEILYLDVNYFFPCGYRARLADRLINPLLVALRLNAVRIEYELPKANIDNPDTPWFISGPIL